MMWFADDAFRRGEHDTGDGSRIIADAVDHWAAAADVLDRRGADSSLTNWAGTLTPEIECNLGSTRG